MSLAEVVSANIGRIKTMREGGRSWDEVAAALADEVGDTISAGSLKAAFSRAAKVAPTPVQIEKMVDAREAQAELESGDDEPFETIDEDDEEEIIPPTPSAAAPPAPQPPAVDRPRRAIDPDLPGHLLRVAGPRLDLPGWPEFLEGPAVSLLANRYGWFRPDDLRRYPTDPDPQLHGQAWLVCRVSCVEFLRRASDQIDVTSFRPDPTAAVIEGRVLARFKVNRRQLFEAVVMTFGPTGRGVRVGWLMTMPGYLAAVRAVDNHLGFDIPTVHEIWRASRGVESAWRQQRAAA